MKRAITLLAIAALLVGEVLGSTPPRRFAYIAHYQYTGTSGKVTLQLPSAATKNARLLELFVSCPTAACTIVYNIGSGLATATAATEYRLRSKTPATAQAQFFTASDATGGTALPAVPLPSGYTATLDVEDIEILPGEAITITASSSSQTVTLIPKWEEF